MAKGKVSEWFWRFLATVMLVAVAWTMWIFYQLNPTPLVTNAAFEAAAKAKANANAPQNAQGVIAPSAGSEPAAVTPAAPVAQAAPEAPKEPKEPPINPDKLKFSDSLSVPGKQ